MKLSIIVFASFFSISAFAAKPKQLPTLTATCNLSDLANQDDPNIKTEKLDLKFNDQVNWASYNGHKYEIAYFDESYKDKASYELSISARDEKTNAVIGSASATFTSEAPSLLFQDGGNVLLNCMSK